MLKQVIEERDEARAGILSENPAAADWIATRGKKWLAHLAGMEAMLAPVDEPLIRALNLNAPCRVADIGCGGGTTLKILRRAPVGSVVHGFDISSDLIELARSRKQSDDRALAFEVGDMAMASAPDLPYDRLVSRFGVMFFDDPLAAFANLFRWLKPGGQFAFAVWDRPSENPWMTTVRQVVAEIIDLPQPDPEAPGPFRYGESDKLLTILNRANFAELAVSHWRGVLPVGGGLRAADAADFALGSFSSFGEVLVEAGDKALNDARQSLASRFSRHQQDGAVRMDASVLVFTGSRVG